MQLTRRKLAAVLTSGVALAQAPAPSPPAVAPTQGAPAQGGDLLQAARDRNHANGAALAAEPIPMATEPAFQFKA